MKRIRNIASFVLSFLITISFVANINFYAEGLSHNEKSNQQFFSELSQMVENAENNGFSAAGINDCSNRILVKTDSNNSLDDKNAIDSVEGFNCWHFFQYSNALDTQAAMDYYKSLSNVEYVELDKPFELDSVPLVDPSDDYPVFDIIPSPDDWGPIAVNSTDIVNKLNNESNLPEIIVAVLDTGIDYSHPYFDYSRIIDSEINTVTVNEGTADGNGHGTHVAGIIYNNTPANVKLEIYKVIDNLGFAYSSLMIIQGITLAASNGAHIINMSLGNDKGIKEYKSFADAISFANSKNAAVIVAAGNDGKELTTVLPAVIPEAITVSCVNKDCTPSGFSNYGSVVDISAPGYQINSTIPYDNYTFYYDYFTERYVSCDDHYYMTSSGTSMAAPFVSAAAAILKTTDITFSPKDIEEILKKTAYKPFFWDESYSVKYGAGLVDFSKMLTISKTPAPTIKLTSEGAIISAIPGAKIYYTTDGSTPVAENSHLYTGEPVKTEGVSIVMAIAVKNGNLASKVSFESLRYNNTQTIRYKGKDILELQTDAKIEKCYSFNENVVGVNKNAEIVGLSVGESVVTILFDNNVIGTYNITVEYAWWQQLIRIFLLGFLWY